jgi:hypothetical protein
MKTKRVKLSEIAIDGGTQQRQAISVEDVEAYAEAMRCGSQFPPATLFFDGAIHWLADGFHRYHAHRAAEIPDMLAEVRDGTKRDALLFSASANGSHGMRLTNADKRKSVMVLMLDSEWSQWSNRDIAKHCHVTPAMVDKIRNEINEKPALHKKEAGVPTVGTSQPEAAPVADMTTALRAENTGKQPEKAELSTGKKAQDETPVEPYDPKDDELAEAHSAVIALAEENTKLRDGIALSDLPEDERKTTAEIIAGLREELRIAHLNIKAITQSRDAFMLENAQMKKQLAMQVKEIKKLEAAP